MKVLIWCLFFAGALATFTPIDYQVTSFAFDTSKEGQFRLWEDREHLIINRFSGNQADNSSSLPTQTIERLHTEFGTFGTAKFEPLTVPQGKVVFLPNYTLIFHHENVTGTPQLSVSQEARVEGLPSLNLTLSANGNQSFDGFYQNFLVVVVTDDCYVFFCL